MRFLFITVLVICGFVLSLSPIYSQSKKGFEIEGGLINSDLNESLSFNLGAKYNYWINSYVGYSIGGFFSHSRIDLMFDSPKEKNVSYNLNDNNIINLSGVLGLKLVTPTFKDFGLMSDFNFLFEPIPFNVASVDKRIYDLGGNRMEEKSKNKMVYTQFNPAFSIQLSLFYDYKQNGKKTRFALGGGITNYNAYNTYYHAKIDDIRLKDHLKLKPNNLSAMIFIRVSGLYL
ncbi:hypothetical protein [Massilibacteroides sp.]|uniref:hypothetical protein n=1 Tax=Massilibacteroides sp. TaxID=2034766 RepID=UPI00260E8D42|nr:hypothetical protein [Massilibacteroides sp.]MDD4516662.1 hypothetical protein [Massilibacteroides sp.]